MIKLHEKHQAPAMQEEAAKAVTIYYEMLQTTPHLDPLHMSAWAAPWSCKCPSKTVSCCNIQYNKSYRGEFCDHYKQNRDQSKDNDGQTCDSWDEEFVAMQELLEDAEVTRWTKKFMED